MLLVILKAKKLLAHFTERSSGEKNQKEFRVGKLIKRKDVKWKGYYISFNSWIDKKGIV